MGGHHPGGAAGVFGDVMSKPKYIVRKRRWPFQPPLKRPWELVRTADDLPISFFETEAKALETQRRMPK